MNCQRLVAGISWAEYSYVSERLVQLLVVQKIAPPTKPAVHLREKFLL